MRVKERLSQLLSSGTFLCVVSVAVWGYALFMSIVVYNLPAGPYSSYVVPMLGAGVMSLLGWYNMERGSTRLEFCIGALALYLTIGAGILMIIDLP